MSYFEKIGNTISTKSKELVQKAKDASEVSSLNSVIKNEMQKIELNYKMMGKLYFEKYGSAPENDFAEAVASIKNSMDKIAQTQEMVRKVKSKNCCPNCSAPFKNGSAFCVKCGTKLSVEEKNTIICTSCGSELTDDAVYCDNCGTKVVPVIQEDNSAPQPKKCPSCGAEAEDELAAFCNECGTKL